MDAADVKQFEEGVIAGKWKAMGELGLPYDGHPLNDPAYFSFYAVAEKYSLPVFFHTGLDGPNPQQFVSPEFRISLGNPLLLEDVTIKFPKLKIIIMHMG